MVGSLDAAVSADAGALDVEYFETLADPHCMPTRRSSGAATAPSTAPRASRASRSLRRTSTSAKDPALLAVVRDYAADGDAFRADLARAWPKLMNLDRFGAAC